MPATPTLARLESHLTDDELAALSMLMNHTIIMHQAGVDSPILRATGMNHAAIGSMLSACKQIYQDINRVRDERAS